MEYQIPGRQPGGRGLREHGCHCVALARVAVLFIATVRQPVPDILRTTRAMLIERLPGIFSSLTAAPRTHCGTLRSGGAVASIGDTTTNDCATQKWRLVL